MFWDLIKYKNININMKNFFTLWFVLSLVLCSCNSGGGYESGLYGNVLEHVVAKDSTLLTGDEVPELSDFVSSHSFVSMRCVRFVTFVCVDEVCRGVFVVLHLWHGHCFHSFQYERLAGSRQVVPQWHG